MFATILKEAKPALLMLFWMTLLTGLAYPLGMTGLARALFPHQAGGSLVLRDAAVVGSSLVGQATAGEAFFHGRPSATAPWPCNAGASGGSNLGPSNPELARAAGQRAAARAALDGPGPVAMEMATASGSGLDPHISPGAAAAQAARVARARGLDPGAVAALVERHVQGRLWGFWGEPRVNVLELNLALDALAGKE